MAHFTYDVIKYMLRDLYGMSGWSLTFTALAVSLAVCCVFGVVKGIVDCFYEDDQK